MSAPEKMPVKIWAFEEYDGGIPRAGDWCDEKSETPDCAVEYIRADLAPALPSADYVAGLGWPAKDGCKGECEYAPTLRAMKREIDQMAVAKLSGQDIKDAICDALGDAMDCTRVWVAWSYGTMSQDDFKLVRDDADRVEEIVAAINNALAARPEQPAAEPAGWVIANGADNRWRCVYEWESNSEWTDDKSQALKFATREDAERFSKDDEDAWLVYPVGLPQPAADTRGVTVEELTLWANNMQNVADEYSAGLADEVACEIRAIIGETGK